MVFRKYKQNCTHIDLTCFLKIVNGNSVDGLLLVIHTTIVSNKKVPYYATYFPKMKATKREKWWKTSPVHKELDKTILILMKEIIK